MIRILLWAIAFNVILAWALLGPAPAGSDSSENCPSFEPYPLAAAKARE
jgi:hypothetical protein